MAVVTACAIPVVAYMGWFSASFGKFAMTNSDGLILYMRTAIFADCDKMDIDKYKELELVLLCINDPVHQRKDYAQWYLWGQGSGDGQGTGEVLHRWGSGKKFTDITNEAASAFATRAITVAARRLSAGRGPRLLPRLPLGPAALPRRGDVQHVRVQALLRAGQHRKSQAAAQLALLPGQDRHRRRTPTRRARRRPGSSRRGRTSCPATRRWSTCPASCWAGSCWSALYGVVVRWRSFGGPVLLPWLGAFGLVLAPGRDGRVRLPLRAAGRAAGLHRGRRSRCAAASLGRGRDPGVASASVPTTPDK